MGPLPLLLTSTVLCSYLHSGSMVNAQTRFEIASVKLSFEPEPDVTCNTNVTVRCTAVVMTRGSEVVTRNYTIFKDDSVLYVKTTSSSEDLLYQLPEVRVYDNGQYKCQINIEDKQLKSRGENLKVTGLSKPVLHINKMDVSEDEAVTAWCTAPSEKGSILFFFYDNSEEIQRVQTNSNVADVKFHLGAGNHNIHCTYTIRTMMDSFKSEDSNAVAVRVTEFPIEPVLEINPQHHVHEGDLLNITCTVRTFQPSSENMEVYLSQDTSIINSGKTYASGSVTARATDTGLKFTCRLKVRNFKKVKEQTVLVNELFSEPALTMDPSEVFQGESMKLTCKSEKVAVERLDVSLLSYTLHPLQTSSSGNPTKNGVFYVKAPQNEFNYTCTAQARGIEKHSKTLTIRPKVYVSSPEISVSGRVIMHSPFMIRCQSDFGSLPITYSLWRDNSLIKTVTVRHPSEEALFEIIIYSPEELNSYICKATNSDKEILTSERLNTTVIVPLTQPELAVVPKASEVYEGNDLYLICRVEGTPPVTFKWYRDGEEKPLNTTTTNTVFADYEIPSLSKEHSGKYYCEAINHANKPVKSDLVDIEVHMALWKKGLIGGTIMLLASLLLMVFCVLFFKSKRGKRERAAELSVKPSSPKSDDSLTVTLTHDTEVYNTATVKVNGTTVSVWSEGKPGAGDDESSTVSNEPDVEYTEVVHSRSVDLSRAPPRKGTDTVYSELQNSSHGASDHHDYGSVEYAEHNGEQLEMSHYDPEINSYVDLPEPVD